VPKCQEGYRHNIGTNFNPSAEKVLKKCIYDVCKVEDPSTPEKCTTCWENSDIKNYYSWDARGSFTEGAIQGRDTSEPFKLEKDRCNLQCGDHYWAETTRDPFKQRCNYSNCKTWDWESPTGNPKVCLSCWKRADIVDYDNWPAKISHKSNFLKYHADEPYELVNGKCYPICSGKYKDNMKVAAETAQWKCGSSVCKKDSINEAGDAICLSCWGATDIANRATWDAADSYPIAIMNPLIQTLPFNLTKEGKCLMNCRDGFSGNHAFEVETELHRCTYTNCKTADWTDASNTKNCLTCWEPSDWENFNEWTGNNQYSKLELYGSHVTVPF